MVWVLTHVLSSPIHDSPTTTGFGPNKWTLAQEFFFLIPQVCAHQDLNPCGRYCQFDITFAPLSQRGTFCSICWK